MTEEEKELIYLLAQKLTGAHPEGTYQIGIFLTNVERRMRDTGIDNLTKYLQFAKDDKEEHGQLLSALSIHTTSWFRENPHYVILQKVLLARAMSKGPYRVWCCACSTGEEIYSFALLFEEFRRFHAKFDYSVMGTDIDPISLAAARRGIFPKKNLIGPVSYYKKHVLLGSGPTEDFFTFSADLRKRCNFRQHDIRLPLTNESQFDLIVCRNVLIYFKAQQVSDVINHLLTHLRPGGHLILGHSEMIDHQKLGLGLRGHAVYEKPELGLKPPVEAKEAPTELDKVEEDSLTQMVARPKRKTADMAVIIKRPANDFNPRLILIGASTGGPQALAQVLGTMPADLPPVIIAQHISSKFSLAFAQRLAQLSGLKLGDSKDKSVLAKGHIYCADSDYHVAVEKSGKDILLRQDRKPHVNGHRPSVDHLFNSALDVADNCIAILLSGMGRDGALGMDALHKCGAYTLAQAEKDCVVFGMPKEAIIRQAVDYIGSAEQMHSFLLEITQHQST